MDSEVQIKEEPVCLEEIASTSLENLELPPEMTCLDAEAKSELIVPGPTQQNTFQASVKVKDEIFVQEQAIHQLVPCVKEENNVENIRILNNRPVQSRDMIMKQGNHLNHQLSANTRRRACLSNSSNIFSPITHLKSNQQSHLKGEPNSWTISSDLSVQKAQLKTVHKKFKCPEWKFKSLTKQQLESHLRVHSGERPFACTVCDSKFKQRGDLRRHIQSHLGVRNFQCAVCEKLFRRKSYLEVHMRIHIGERSFVCLVCRRTFTRKHHLKSHMRVHPGMIISDGRPESGCSVCRKIFHSKRELVTHMGDHSKEWPFACSICHNRFVRKGELRSHLRFHSENYFYRCSLCDGVFGTKIKLISHLRSHSEERPFRCSVCESTFARKGDLRRHLKTHYGKRPFRCLVCNNTFCRSAHLERHKNTCGRRPVTLHSIH
ncbi:gastrula zinc finger protein XlCGF57.1-like [Anabrus simplex]|uniref:gastrula zinc finger protein XlCGF57.1-like n=1 Tax=Anabrus simplex TaxID=316456 RepID=UPI0035A3555C